MHTNFSITSTSTPGKIRHELNWVNPQIKPALPGDEVIMLMGAPDGYDRQIQPFLDAGYTRERITIVDHDRAVVEALEPVNAGRSKLVHGDFFTVLRAIIDEGRSIGFADFDGTMCIDSLHFELVAYCEKHVRQLHIVTPNRCYDGGVETCNRFATLMNMPTIIDRVYVPKEEWPNPNATNYQKRVRRLPGPKKVLLEFIRRARGSVNMKAYTGRGPMLSFFVNF